MGIVVDLDSLAPPRCGIEIKPARDLRCFSSEEAIQVTSEKSMVLLRPEIMPKESPEVFLHQYSLKVAI